MTDTMTSQNIDLSSWGNLYTAQTKFLWVYVTEKLKWNTHVESLANKLSKVSLMIKSLNEIMSPFMTRNIYFLKFQLLSRFGILFFLGGGG